MDAHTQLVIATTVATLAGLVTFAFLGWVVWGVFWDAYDHVMQLRTRKRLSRPDYSVGRDVFRDTKGVTR